MTNKANPRRSRAEFTPTAFVDEHGRRCLRVPLDRYRQREAIALASDYHRLIRSGVSVAWYLNKDGDGREYVRTKSRKGCTVQNNMQLARLITGAGRGTVVRYANGDRLDLRPENLQTGRGKSKWDTLALVEQAAFEAENEGADW